MNASLPFISVIVPAYNRPDGLKALLSALAEQSYPPYRFEVLIGDDGSTPPLAEQVSVKDCPYSVRFLREANQGPATARNRGAREARGTILAFTDDDCLPSPEWLEAIAQTLAGETSVHGPTRSSVPPIEPFIHSVHIDRAHGVATANFAVRKDAFWQVGGFDETFAAPYFEDEDLSRRLQAAYGPHAWNEAMRVEHPPRRASIKGWWRSARYSYYLPYMQRKYAGYWSGTLPAILRRVIAKTVLVVLGLLPLFGFSGTFWLAWAALFAWQAQRLRKILRLAVTYQVKLPLSAQLAFLALEWTVDYVRLASYLKGLGLKEKPAPPHELEEFLL
ncbi:MAG TPA: glycosyltransferase family 2 protein [Oscillatoriaceae cyanobacterium]